jgi:hypothetical protein
MTPDAIVNMFSNITNISFFGNSLGLIGLAAYIGEVAFWNTIQGIIDITSSFIIGIILFRRIPSLSSKQ